MGQEATVFVIFAAIQPEINRIEILWKHAKYFSRRFASVNGADLLAEIQSLMKGLGSEFTVNFG